MNKVCRKISFLIIITFLLKFAVVSAIYGADYTIPGIDSYMNVFYNHATYWPRLQYPYLYDWFGLGEFNGCCHANSSLQICLYYDDRGYNKLVDNPHTPQSTQQARDNDLKAMGDLVALSYTPDWMKFFMFWKQFPPDWKTAVEFYANSKGYNFQSEYFDQITESKIKSEIQNDRPVQVLLYSADAVIVGGNPYDSFYHSTVAVGYEEEADDFRITLYWGWQSLPEIEITLDSDFDRQFENKGMIMIHPSNFIVALVIDRSGSMASANKLSKAKEAARYFVEDTRTGDQIAISAFDDTGLLVTSLTHIDDETPDSPVKKGIKAQINTLTPGGMTNFGAGLQIAYNELKKSTTNMPKTGVLMTNGQHNTGTYDAQVNAFKNEGWPIYTIGFGSDVNENTLKQIANDTGGKYYYAESIDITAIYDLISGRIHNDSLIAAVKGFIKRLQSVVFRDIWVDLNMKWLKFSAFWGGSHIDLSLIRPDGIRIDPPYAMSDPDINYYESDTYSYYVIRNPMAGEWKAELFGADIPAVGEQFNLNVKASSPIFSDFFLAFKPEYDIGERVNIAVQLANVTDNLKLKPISGASVTSEILMPNGKTESLVLLETESGIYSGEYGNTNTKGLYSVKIVAKGAGDSGQFTRRLQTMVQVGKPPFNNPPEAVAKLITQGCGLKIGLPIEFNGFDSSDPDGDSLTCKWDFGDGKTSTDINPVHQYVASGIYNVTLIVNDGKMDSLPSKLEVEIRLKPSVVSAAYDVSNTTLILNFNLPMMRNPVCFDGIGMEVSDSGNWDFTLSNSSGLRVNETKPSRRITIDINRAYTTTINLAIAGLVNHKKVDLLLNKGAFVDECGDDVMIAKGTDNIIIKIMSGGYTLGVLGDADGDGEITAYDAGLVLKSAHLNDLQRVIPVYEAASKTTEWLKAKGYDIDVLMNMIDIDKDRKITSYDAALILQIAISKKNQAPILSSNLKYGRLKLCQYYEQNLKVSVELDNVSGVYSADIGLTYDPNELSVLDVSKASSISGWLSEYETNSSELRISMAGASQPTLNGSLVTIIFRAASRDSIKKLDITKIELNGGKLGSCIENLPKFFAAMQNYPNPFNPDTWIPYQLVADTDVIIKIYDVSGKLIRRLELGNMSAGFYTNKDRAAYWNGKNESGEQAASGIYFYTIQAGDFTAIRKMLMLK